MSKEFRSAFKIKVDPWISGGVKLTGKLYCPTCDRVVDCQKEPNHFEKNHDEDSQ